MKGKSRVWFLKVSVLLLAEMIGMFVIIFNGNDLFRMIALVVFVSSMEQLRRMDEK